MRALERKNFEGGGRGVSCVAGEWKVTWESEKVEVG